MRTWQDEKVSVVELGKLAGEKLSATSSQRSRHPAAGPAADRGEPKQRSQPRALAPDFASPAAAWMKGAIETMAPKAAAGNVVAVDFGGRGAAEVSREPVLAEVIEHINLNSSRSDKETIHLALAFALIDGRRRQADGRSEQWMKQWVCVPSRKVRAEIRVAARGCAIKMPYKRR